jgi:bifunctional UDP-N-acetylglucosamine pyrophosphorylase / glucosamine-1-phosphate N-acetyltransferase
MENTCVFILAAGKGERMSATMPKALVKLAGRPIVFWCLDTLIKAGFKNIYLIVGYKSTLVKNTVLNANFPVDFIKQKQLKGTAHSIKIALRALPSKFKNILVLYADDSAFYKKNTLLEFLKFHKTNKHKITFLTSVVNSANPIGGLKIDNDGKVVDIFRQSYIVNNNLEGYPILCGAFCFNRAWIKKNINKIEKSDLSGEYPLPQIYKIALDQGCGAYSYRLNDADEWMSINTRDELKKANDAKIKSI